MVNTILGRSSRISTTHGAALLARRLMQVLAAFCLLAAMPVSADQKQGSVEPVKLAIPGGAYGLDKTHAYITFAYSHMGFSTPHVSFNEFDVVLELNADDPSRSRFEVAVNAASIDTRVAKFDELLRGDEYFDVANHPVITFVANSITIAGATTAKVVGELTIKGVTKPLTLDLTLNKAANHPMLRKPVLGVSATGKLKRSDWALGKYAPAVGDEVTIYVSVELPKKD